MSLSAREYSQHILDEVDDLETQGVESLVRLRAALKELWYALGVG